jgi:hypothetical protein
MHIALGKRVRGLASVRASREREKLNPGSVARMAARLAVAVPAP